MDFADDNALLDNIWDGIKHLTERIQTEAANVGLAINPDKTIHKNMEMAGDRQDKIDEITMEEVGDF